MKRIIKPIITIILTLTIVFSMTEFPMMQPCVVQAATENTARRYVDFFMDGSDVYYVKDGVIIKNYNMKSKKTKTIFNVNKLKEIKSRYVRQIFIYKNKIYFIAEKKGGLIDTTTALLCSYDLKKKTVKQLITANDYIITDKYIYSTSYDYSTGYVLNRCSLSGQNKKCIKKKFVNSIYSLNEGKKLAYPRTIIVNDVANKLVTLDGKKASIDFYYGESCTGLYSNGYYYSINQDHNTDGWLSTYSMYKSKTNPADREYDVEEFWRNEDYYGKKVRKVSFYSKIILISKKYFILDEGDSKYTLLDKNMKTVKVLK